jgi:hypothetical protein
MARPTILSPPFWPRGHQNKPNWGSVMFNNVEPNHRIVEVFIISLTIYYCNLEQLRVYKLINTPQSKLHWKYRDIDSISDFKKQKEKKTRNEHIQTQTDTKMTDKLNDNPKNYPIIHYMNILAFALIVSS